MKLKKRLQFGYLSVILILVSSIIVGLTIPCKVRRTGVFVSYIGYDSINEMVDESHLICRVRILSVNSTGTGMFKNTRFNAKIIKSYKDEALQGSTIVVGIRGWETETEILEESMNPFFRIGDEEILFLGHPDKNGVHWFQGAMGRFSVKPGRVYPLWWGPLSREIGETVDTSQGYDISKFERLVRYYVDN